MSVRLLGSVFCALSALGSAPAWAQTPQAPSSASNVVRIDPAMLARPEVQRALTLKVRKIEVDPASLARFADSPATDLTISQGPDPLSSPATLSPAIMQALRSRPAVQASGIESIAPAPRVRAFRAAPRAQAPGARKLNLPDQLDGNGFLNDLHAALAPNVVGYTARLRKGGANIGTLQWNWAQTPADGSLGWNPDRRMHLASVSKLMTAIGLTRVLDDNNISYNTPIINYLPDYWARGAGVSQITFADLMTHRSGYNVSNPCCDQSFTFLRQRIAAGPNASVGDVGRYHNLNFGLQRVLIAVVGGYIDKDTNFGQVNEPVWNAVTNSAYNSYMQEFVFKPAGVTGATMTKPAGPARAYLFPTSGAGWNSGPMAEQSGGAAWHMSVDEVLDVMDALRRKGTIMTNAKAQIMLDRGFGLDSGAGVATDAGKLYHKNGRWQNGSGASEQSVVFFLPGDMELAVFVNSPIGTNNVFLRSLVQTIYVNNLFDPN